MSPSDNPYTQATQSYTTSGANKTGRELEAAVLLKSSIKMEILAKKMKNGEKVRVQEMGDILDANQKIWQIFLSNMMDENYNIPQEIKNNIANLAIFVFKRTNEIFLKREPEKIQALIDINRNIATGLSKKPATPIQNGKKEEKAPQPDAASLDSVI